MLRLYAKSQVLGCLGQSNPHARHELMAFMLIGLEAVYVGLRQLSHASNDVSSP